MTTEQRALDKIVRRRAVRKGYVVTKYRRGEYQLWQQGRGAVLGLEHDATLEQIADYINAVA